MHSVGRFLQALKERLKQYSLPSSPPYSTLIPHGSMVLYYGRNYTYGKVTQKIVDIFKGLPHSFQVFHCHRETTEEELHLFMKRVSKHPQHYVLVQVNKLPFKLQEVRNRSKTCLLQLIIIMIFSLQMFLRNTYSPNESTCAGQCSTIHFIESAPSILQDLPWVVSKKEEVLVLADLMLGKESLSMHITFSTGVVHALCTLCNLGIKYPQKATIPLVKKSNSLL